MVIMSFQNTSLLNELGEGSINYPASLDTFHISIMAPHLYIQSTAVEKGICTLNPIIIITLL